MFSNLTPPFNFLLENVLFDDKNFSEYKIRCINVHLQISYRTKEYFKRNQQNPVFRVSLPILVRLHYVSSFKFVPINVRSFMWTYTSQMWTIIRADKKHKIKKSSIFFPFIIKFRHISFV